MSRPHQSTQPASRRPRLPVAPLVGIAVLGVGVAAVVAFGIESVLAAAGTLALLAVAGLAAGLVALLGVLRRRLAELRHLPDLGRRVVTSLDRATVTGVTRDAGGVVLHVAACEVSEVTLDESGAPDHASVRAAGTSQWRLPSSMAADPTHVAMLTSLQQQRVPVRIVAESVVALTGPIPTGWRLEADNGLVVRTGT